MVDLSKIKTEQRNENSMGIHAMSTDGILKIINDEDHKVAQAVKAVLPQISKAVDAIYNSLYNGGRLIYCGAGTSGRLAILDAAECPPTYNTNPETVQAIMAGGSSTLTRAKENAEDDAEMGEEDLKNIKFSSKDILVGVAASGRTPYVLGAMSYAKSLGSTVIALTCCPGSEIDTFAHIGIAPTPGAEVVTGSTRMKSGTAQKLVLNMLSTATMIKLGKVYENLMVDVKATNKKLVERCINIVCTATDCEREEAVSALAKCNNSAKIAITMILCGKSAQEAQELINKADGHIEKAKELNKA